MNKKGQGLSLNTIIIAIIVIIVLVIIILITTGQLQKFTQGINKQASDNCVEKGGICTTQEYCNSIQGTATEDDTCGTKICCVRKV